MKNKLSNAEFAKLLTLIFLNIVSNSETKEIFNKKINELTTNLNNLIIKYHNVLIDLNINHSDIKSKLLFKDDFESQLEYFENISEQLSLKYKKASKKITENYYTMILDDQYSYFQNFLSL